MTDTATFTAADTGSEPRRLWRVLGFAADIGLSPATYYLLLAAGFTSYRALVGSTIVAGGWALGVAAARRKADGIAVFVFLLNALGLVLAVLGGDERMMLAKDPITSAVISVLLAGSCLLGRPAMFAISQRMHALGPDSAVHWETLWHNDSVVRRAFTIATAVWSAGLAVDAVVRLLVIYCLPVPAAVALMNPVQWTIIAALAVYTVRSRRRLDIKTRLRALPDAG
ncbi:VC0807 family protein [Nocardia nova]|uniref:VC0807 family protein n=1 Tax=Nocardia nova TaxID=37330 RepID=UPI000CE9B8DA|nr:VC0807 family protein [Nocardia nova]PPI90773.1 hypothetical protein C5E46_31080 [Nocardia nova]PPJ10594.1 hypothetical protein C5E51_09935 [Nocardia nova]